MINKKNECVINVINKKSSYNLINVRPGNICNSTHLFSFPESLAVRLLQIKKNSYMLKISGDSFDCLNLDEDVDDGQVALGVFVNLFFYCESQCFVVQPLP